MKAEQPTTCVLARTNRALRQMEEALSSAGIKYHLLGGSGYWASPEVRSSLAWLGLCYSPADYLLAAAIRSPFPVTKYLPKTALCARLKELDQPYWALLTKEPHVLAEPKHHKAIAEFVSAVHSMTRYRDLPAQEAVKKVLEALRAFDVYADQDDIDNSPADNLVDLIKQAGRFTTLKEFLDYARRASAASKGRKGVALGTIHASKGLEFSRVFMIQCSEGVIPHAKSTDLDGERNAWFVGCSRAERELILTYSGVPSQFLPKEKINGSN